MPTRDEENTVTRKICKQHYYTSNISIPKKWLVMLGALMAKKVKLELIYDEKNPLNSEIRLRFIDPKKS